jgi:hypothetical protein
VFLGVRYSECSTRPVRIHPAGCACDGCACDYSRVRDDFCLGTLWQIPDCYLRQAKIDVDLLTRFKAFKAAAGGAIEGYANLMNSRTDNTGFFAAGQNLTVNLPPPPPLPVPDCLCCTDPWVILATIRLPAKQSTPITAQDIHYLHRRVLYSESALFLMALAT